MIRNRTIMVDRRISNRTVELVNEWAVFEQAHPNGDISDFCRYYLAKQERRFDRAASVGGVVPPLQDGLMLKIIGRIHKLNAYFANAALKGTALQQIEEFGLLLTIRQMGRPTKTDVILANLFEVSSGMDMLRRLQQRGLVRDEVDDTDKRAKRIILTPEGERALEEGLERVGRNAQMMTHGMSPEDKQLCIQLLEELEVVRSRQWIALRGKSFETIYNEITGFGSE